MTSKEIAKIISQNFSIWGQPGREQLEYEISTAIDELITENTKLEIKNRKLQKSHDLNLERWEVSEQKFVTTREAELKAENRNLKQNITELEVIAESWMNDYDKLKEKYEPMEVVIQEIGLIK